MPESLVVSTMTIYLVLLAACIAMIVLAPVAVLLGWLWDRWSLSRPQHSDYTGLVDRAHRWGPNR